MKLRSRILIPVLSLLILAATAAGGWLWYDNNVDRSGWREEEGIWSYRDFYGDPVSGWLELEDGLYCFHDDGTPRTGWQTLEGATYYFGDYGILHTGWLEQEGKRYYFGGNGVLVEGWLWLPEGRYFLSGGAAQTGWYESEDGRRYFDETGLMCTGFLTLEDGVYYLDGDGLMVTGRTRIEENTYLFREDGVMHTGWEECDEGWRYYHDDGTMAVGWQEMDGESVYFHETGLRQESGWFRDGEYRYYFKETGSLATGPTVIDGQTYYFTPDGIEVMLVNAVTPIPDNYQQTIVNVVDYHDVDSRCYDALVQMLADMTEAGVEYNFNSAYRTWAEQTAILEYRTLEYLRDLGCSFTQAREKALETVAIPNTSEHQLGLSVDLVGTAANEWLAQNCWDYGFILRYPENKHHVTGIVNEPWHFRYVGTRVSLAMKDTGLCLEEYLGAPAVTQAGIEAVHGDKWFREEFYTVTSEVIAGYTPLPFYTHAS